MKKTFTLFALLLMTLAAAAQSYKTLENIPYHTGTGNAYADERCKLDFYYPTDKENFPVAVFFHGGGLTGGEKYLPAELLESGIGIVTVNYRLLPKAELPDIIDDAAAAVAWTFKNIGQYGGNVQRIYVSGHSAGGYLTDMIGLDKKWLAKYDVDADSICALFPFSGQVITHFALREQRGIKNTTPLVDEWAPLFHIRPDAPPIVIISADREMEMLGRYEETAYFWRMLKVCGHKNVHMYEVQGFNHGNMASPAALIMKRYILSMERGRWPAREAAF
ncbi:MAG: alpha/beta hydrolase [Bacteroidaceae bacterium]|nr:alpha/beta hydrolase [Bacteroidaceae bacterium]